MPRQINPPIEAQIEQPEMTVFPGFEFMPSVIDRPKDVGRLALYDTGRYERAIEGTVSITGPNGFELTMTDELHDAITHKFGQVRKHFGELTGQIMADPFGESSIDAFKDTDAGQWARLVHRVDGPLADLIPGKKLAIKGTGIDMEATRNYLEFRGPRRTSLTRQFRETLELSRQQKSQTPEGMGGCVFVNEVYGVLRHKQPDGSTQEWLLMEHIENAESVANREVVLSRGGVSLAFSREAEPALADIADPFGLDRRQDNVLFSRLAEGLSTNLGQGRMVPRALSDLNGNNILKQQTPEGPRYTLIDVASV